jgi:hypothetical protein
MRLHPTWQPPARIPQIPLPGDASELLLFPRSDLTSRIISHHAESDRVYESPWILADLWDVGSNCRPRPSPS